MTNHPPEALAAWRVGGADPERKETMSDDLNDIKSDLRTESEGGDVLCRAALAQIETIEAENAALKARCINAEDDGYRRGLQKAREVFSPRIEELEAKLAKATETLARIVRGEDDAHNWAIWTLAELKGLTGGKGEPV